MRKAFNIKWDVDYEEDLESLPTEIEIPEDLEDDDDISDYLSDTTGFCHAGFEIGECVDGLISRNKKDNGNLEIYLGDYLLATIENGDDDEKFVEDVLYGMGYVWNEDGTVIKLIY
jgi:hypothetical protein